MSDATIFYILGSALAVMAVATSFIGLRVESFPGRFGPVVLQAIFVLVVAAITIAIKNGQHEEEVRAAENDEANKVIEEEEEEPVPAEGEKGAEKPAGEAGAKGPGGTLKLAASPTDLAFNTKALVSKPGKVTIDFDNPAALEHNVAIEEGETVIAESETLSEGKTTVSADLGPGNYTFLCTVPGHAEAGMEGTLTVK
jgi:plastocyanin